MGHWGRRRRSPQLFPQHIMYLNSSHTKATLFICSLCFVSSWPNPITPWNCLGKGLQWPSSHQIQWTLSSKTVFFSPLCKLAGLPVLSPSVSTSVSNHRLLGSWHRCCLNLSFSLLYVAFWLNFNSASLAHFQELWRILFSGSFSSCFLHVSCQQKSTFFFSVFPGWLSSYSRLQFLWATDNL